MIHRSKSIIFFFLQLRTTFLRTVFDSFNISSRQSETSNRPMSIGDQIGNIFRCLVPALCLFGAAPTFFVIWFFLRVSSLIFLPAKVYRRYDDHLYSLYQRSVLFFFEHWMQIKVCQNSICESFVFSNNFPLKRFIFTEIRTQSSRRKKTCYTLQIIKVQVKPNDFFLGCSNFLFVIFRLDRREKSIGS